MKIVTDRDVIYDQQRNSIRKSRMRHTSGMLMYFIFATGVLTKITPVDPGRGTYLSSLLLTSYILADAFAKLTS